MLGLTEFINGGFGIVNKLIEVHKLDEWAKLIFGFALSWFITATGAAGSALVAGQSLLVATGAGLVSGAGVLLFLMKQNPKTKGIWFAYSNELRIDLSKYQAEVKTK